MADPVRTLISQRIEERGIKLNKLSRMLGKSDAYMQQFLKRGVPERLPEDVREQLAEILDIPEERLGRRVPKSQVEVSRDKNKNFTYVTVRDVRASAGAGTLIEGEGALGQWPFPTAYLRHSLSLNGDRLSVVEVRGDSMEPTLRSGDKILVDHDDTDVVQPGVFALYDGNATVVKRVEKIPASDPVQLMLISDNPAHGRYSVLADQVNIAGRIVWFGRRL